METIFNLLWRILCSYIYDFPADFSLGNARRYFCWIELWILVDKFAYLSDLRATSSDDVSGFYLFLSMRRQRWLFKAIFVHHVLR